MLHHAPHHLAAPRHALWHPRRPDPAEWASRGDEWAAAAVRITGARRERAAAYRARRGSAGARWHASGRECVDGRGSTASIQEVHIGIERIEQDVAWLDSGRACAVLEVDGLNLAMLDEAAREARLAAFAGLLNALTHRIQILVGITPLNLASYVQRLEERAPRALPRPRRPRQRPRRPPAADRGRHTSSWRSTSTSSSPTRTRGTSACSGGSGAARRCGETARRLAFRCEELEKLLRRCDLAARRLDGTALAYLYRDWWGADGVGDRGLADIAEFCTPAVRARRRIALAVGRALARRGRRRPRTRPAAAARPPRPPPRPPRRRGRRPPTPTSCVSPRGRGRSPTSSRRPRSRSTATGCASTRPTRGRWRSPATRPPSRPAGCGQLTGFDEPLDLALHIRPLDTGRMIESLNRKLVLLQSSALADEQAGRLGDKAREIAVEQIDALQDALQRGEERLFSVACYVILRAATPDALAARAGAGPGGHRGDAGPVAPGPLRDGRGAARGRADGRGPAAARAQPGDLVAGDDLPLRRGPGLDGARGALRPDAARALAAILDPFDEARFTNGNTLVCARSGAGKSAFVKVTAARSLLAGVHYIIVDPRTSTGASASGSGGSTSAWRSARATASTPSTCRRPASGRPATPTRSPSRRSRSRGCWQMPWATARRGRG